jgi:predicted aldo/keto reductase-like oxidoreductase
MLKWVLNHEEVATIIPGMTTFDQLDLDWSVASDLSYTEEERSFLAERDLQGLIQFCQQCKECLPTCPKGVDIPTLMRTHMYAAQYSNFTHARMTLDEIPARQSIFACGSCTECTARCNNSINIAARIDTLKSMYLA